MTPADLSRLLLLSAIWGASFLFMRIGAPVLGPARLIFLRVGLAALFLLAIAFYLRKPLAVRRYWKHYLVLGCCNSALPFLLFAYAAQTVSASLLAILNATAPLWALAVGTLWFKSRPTPGAMFGMLLGIVGVALVAGVETLALPAGGGLAVVAALGAAASYGVASTYTKTAPAVEPLANAHGSMWAATAMLLPLALLAPPLAATPASPVLFSVAALGIVAGIVHGSFHVVGSAAGILINCQLALEFRQLHPAGYRLDLQRRDSLHVDSSMIKTYKCTGCSERSMCEEQRGLRSAAYNLYASKQTQL